MESTPTSSWEEHCPKPEKLDAFYRGELPPEDVPPLANHLANCPRCTARLQVWRTSDALSVNASQAAAPTVSLPDPPCPGPTDDGTRPGAGSSSLSIPIVPTAANPSPPPAAPLPNSLGVYELLSKRGQGGMGAVYMARHTRLKRLVALKTLAPNHLNDADAVNRFNREMEAVGKLDHPNIVRATDAGEIDGVHFLVMEYVEGLDLAELLRRRGPLPIADACALAYQVAVGLQYVYENGLVHRDVKPSNLMLTPAGQLKILDLGLALLYEMPAPGKELTGSRQMVGTVDYMAPEQGVDAHEVDIRADIYSLGCTLYKLLTDHVPFGGPSYNTPMKKAMAHAQAAPPPLRTYRPETPPQLASIVERMMAKVPARRFATPGEAADKLRPFTATADLVQLLANAREQAVQLRGDGKERTPSLLAVKGSKTSGRQTAASSITSFFLSVGTHPWVRYSVLTAVLIALAGAGAFLAGRSWFNVPAPPPVVKMDETARPPFKRGTWTNLLDRPPVPLLWPIEDVLPSLDADKQKLVASCSNVGLLALGTTPSVGYQFQLGVSQPPPWTGGVGLFFGYHKDAVQGKPSVCYQTIYLQWRGPPVAKSQAYQLVRGKCWRSEDGFLAGDSTVKAQILPAPKNSEQILAIEVTSGGRLLYVRWNGQEISDLTSPQVNASFKPNDYIGDFGAVNIDSSSVYSNARFFLNAKDD